MRTCACAILLKDGRLLLGKRASHRKAYPDKWDLIGGRVEDGEVMEDALARELHEELGIAPPGSESLGSFLDRSAQAQGQAVYHIYAVRTWTGGQPRIANHEHSALRWFTIAEACALADLALDEYRSVFSKLML